VSEDTDVFVLYVSFSSQVPCPLYVKCGSKTRTRYFNVKKMAQMLGADKCKALPGLHAFTGCDTVSAFACKGKLKGLGLISKSAQHREALTLLGSHWDITDDLHKKLESFTCQLYCSTLVESVNDLRYDLFLAKKGEIQSWQLPPCSLSLLSHCKRANYQCAIWKRSLEASPQVPSLVGSGWCMEGDDLAIDWGEGLPAPQAVMELLSCDCKKRMCSGQLYL